jgi:hypothetical protein
MTQQENTLAVLAKHLLGVFSPLAEAFASEEQFKGFLYRMGWNASSLPPQYVDLATSVADGIARLEQFLRSSNPPLSDILTLVGKAKTIYDKADGIAVAPPGVDAGTFLGEFKKKLVDLLLVDYLVREMPAAFGLFSAMKVIETKSLAATPQRPAFVQIVFNWDKIPAIFSNPIDIFKQVYGWGTPTFDTSPLFKHLASLLYGLGFPVNFVLPDDEFLLGYAGGATPSLGLGKRGLKMPFYYTEALGKPLEFSMLFLEKPATAGKLPGLVVQPQIPSEVPLEFRFGNFVVLKIKTGTNLGTLFGLTISPNEGLKVRYPLQNTNAAPGFTFGATVEFKPEQPVIIFGDPTASRFQFRGGNVGFEINSIGTDVEAKLFADVNELTVILSAGSGDGFLQKIIGSGETKVGFPLGIDWSSRIGFGFRGSPNLEVALNPHLSLGPIEIPRVIISLKMPADNSSQIKVDSGLDIKGDLGPLKFVVENIGISLKFSAQKGNLGPFDLSLGFKPPNGVGLSLDVGMVKGGGYLYFNSEKEEYGGVLELSFTGIVTVKAIGLITTRMPDGSKGFSLLLIITAEFGTGIQLGFGFTLLGVGGLLGLNRTMLLEPLASGIRTGAINSIMFPPDPVANAPRILSDLRTYFPAYEGKFLIGPMVKIGWGTPTLISLAFGLIIEIPGNVAIVGVLRIVLPEEHAPIVVINVAFVGALEFDKSRIWFFASMFDSRILFMTMEGDMGLLMDFGSNPNFVLSVGGFHPQFNPPPLPFPNPRRIHIDVLRTPVSRITVENYFAVTSNTVQFGARAEIFYGIDDFNIHGNFSFDALFQFSPFHFIIDISFSVGMDVFGAGVFSISLKLTLEGPAPWRARGTGTLSIDLWLFSIDISVDFDITWGEADNPKLPSIDAIPILVGELNKANNWKAELPRSVNLLVSLRKLDETKEKLVLHPVGTLRISQRAVPLGVQVDKVGNRPVSDAHHFSVTVKSAGLSKVGQAPVERFAIAQFQNLSDAEKLSRASFENIESGLELASAGKQFSSGKVVKRVVRYEVNIIDGDNRYFSFRWFKHIGTLFFHWLGGAAVSQSALSFARKKSMVPTMPEERVKVGQPGYVLAGVSDNKPLSGTTVFASEVHARDYMQAHINSHPAAADEVHIIPTFEATLS